VIQQQPRHGQLHGLVQLRDGDLQAKRGQQRSSDVNGYRSSGDRNGSTSRRRTDDGGSDVQVDRLTMGCGKLQTRHGQQWVCDNGVEVYRHVLDKSVAWTGDTFAEGCYATLPYTVTSTRHQQPTADDGEEEVKVKRRMLDKLLALSGVTYAEGCYATLPYATTTPPLLQPTTSDDINEVKVDHQMLNKSAALTGETFTWGCYATLPNTVMVSQHQQSTVQKRRQ